MRGKFCLEREGGIAVEDMRMRYCKSLSSSS